MLCLATLSLLEFGLSSSLRVAVEVEVQGPFSGQGATGSAFLPTDVAKHWSMAAHHQFTRVVVVAVGGLGALLAKPTLLALVAHPALLAASMVPSSALTGQPDSHPFKTRPSTSLAAVAQTSLGSSC